MAKESPNLLVIFNKDIRILQIQESEQNSNRLQAKEIHIQETWIIKLLKLKEKSLKICQEK